jgi:hypothetical protein
MSGGFWLVDVARDVVSDSNCNTRARYSAVDGCLLYAKCEVE